MINSFKALNKLGAIFCTLLLMGGYFIESFYSAHPCVLCILQRGMFYSSTIFFLVNSLNFTKRLFSVCFSVLALCSNLLGLGLALRLIWLQHLPVEQMPKCMADLEQMFAVYPLWEVVKNMLLGSADCAKDNFLLLGLSLPIWTALAFSVLIILSLTLLSKLYSSER